MKYTTLIFLELPHQIEQFNNSLAKIITDTGAKVSVCSLRQAKQWGLYDKIYKPITKLKPFNSELRVRSLVVSDLHSKTKGSRFESGC